MKIKWEITDEDIAAIKSFVILHDNVFVKRRIEINVKHNNLHLNKDTLLHTLLMCLLTGQQRSGPNSRIGKFLSIKPSPVNFQSISQENNIEKYIHSILKEHGLTRYINKISQNFAHNFHKLENNNWRLLEKIKALIANSSNKKNERALANEVTLMFKGIGPKQSRIFLQALGVTKYEIPIDSRITKWLIEFGFPVTLSPNALSASGYYDFVLDGIQAMCAKAKIYPCVLDAAIFSSYDSDQ